MLTYYVYLTFLCYLWIIHTTYLTIFWAHLGTCLLLLWSKTKSKSKNGNEKCDQNISSRTTIHSPIDNILLYVHENCNWTIHQRKYNYFTDAKRIVQTGTPNLHFLSWTSIQTLFFKKHNVRSPGIEKWFWFEATSTDYFQERFENHSAMNLYMKMSYQYGSDWKILILNFRYVLHDFYI